MYWNDIPSVLHTSFLWAENPLSFLLTITFLFEDQLCSYGDTKKKCKLFCWCLIVGQFGPIVTLYVVCFWAQTSKDNSLVRSHDNIHLIISCLSFFMYILCHFVKSSSVVLDNDHQIHIWRICVYIFVIVSFFLSFISKCSTL